MDEIEFRRGTAEKDGSCYCADVGARRCQGTLFVFRLGIISRTEVRLCSFHLRQMNLEAGTRP